MTTVNPLPYGTLDLDPPPPVVTGRSGRIRCYVRGCTKLLRPPAIGYDGEACPVHGIRCHRSGTYSYVDVRRNIIIDADLLATRIVGHPFKFDSKCLGQENSEDALTWNVFRSLQQARCLKQVARWITGLDIKEEPRLYLWGICLTGNTFEPWELLIAARKRFECNLPVKRPLTEPDIALYLPGHYLILIEAKFTSPNPFYLDGPRRDECSLTKNELLDIYQDPGLHMLDVDKARRAERVYYQLWRNMVFAEWLARAAGGGTLAYVANMSRAALESGSCKHFQGMMNSESVGRFTNTAWEDICSLPAVHRPDLSYLRRYLQYKTAGLQQALKCGKDG